MDASQTCGGNHFVMYADVQLYYTLEAYMIKKRLKITTLVNKPRCYI